MTKNESLIKIIDLAESKPYRKFNEFYNSALGNNQSPINAIVISSFDNVKTEVDSRFVNLKYICGDEWTFFSNYSGPKSKQFRGHDQISAIIYWDSIDVQIRMKAKIREANKDLSDQHFKNRSYSKNAIAISSTQSSNIDSYDSVVKNYEETLKTINNSTKRPKYWGGYTFTPYYFEFWEGNKNRINRRQVFEIDNNSWDYYFLQP
tara:strand:- start:504 stop:1121 length:618 start_codon:yes stop_codon:yes gene_type:complete